MAVDVSKFQSLFRQVVLYNGGEEAYPHGGAYVSIPFSSGRAL